MRGPIALFASRIPTPDKAVQDLPFLMDKLQCILTQYNLQNEFQFQLIKSTADPDIVLNFLVGWRDSLRDKPRVATALDYCITLLRVNYPENYEQVNAKAPIHKPS